MFVFWFKVWFEWYEQVSMFCVSDQDRMKIIIRQVWKFERKENSKLKNLCIAGYITQCGRNCSVLLFVEENWTSWCICLPNKVNQKEICISSWYHVSVIWVCLISKLAVICLLKEMPYILLWTWGPKKILYMLCMVWRETVGLFSQESWCFLRQSWGKHQDSRENRTN